MQRVSGWGPKRPFADINTQNNKVTAGRQDEEGDNKAGPSILELQNAIAAAARVCGRPRLRFTSKLPRNHPVQVALEETISLRSLEHNHIARHLLDKTVYRLRRKIKILVGIAQAEYFLTNPRAPRPKTRGQHLIRGLCSGAPGADISFDLLKKAKS
jgi:hypothetical protein